MMDNAQVTLQKAVLWEQAKGALRAMVVAEGCRRLCEPQTAETMKRAEDRWLDVDRVVEETIAFFEDHGYSD